MKLIIAGGRGHVGAVLLRAFHARDIETVVLSRSTRPIPNATRVVPWDGKTLGDWRHEIDGADVVINLAGRSVDCRYHATHLAEMLESRMWSTSVTRRSHSPCQATAQGLVASRHRDHLSPSF